VNGAGLVNDLADHLEDLYPDGSAAVLGRRPLEVAEWFSKQVGCGDPNVTSADVATDDEPRPGVDYVCDRLAPALASTPPGGANEPSLLEPADRGRNGRLREVGGRCDLRPGDRARAKDRFEYRLLTELPQEAQA
jgi:hypothetical protein